MLGDTMNQFHNFDTILELMLSGSMAHFRKFYTNASSLSYSIPPRTTICGLIASILLMPRDSYYDILSSKNLGVAVRIAPNSEARKQSFTVNYVGYEDKMINDVSGHKQCRLELLLPSPGSELRWYIYLGFRKDMPELQSLENRIINQNLGYDVYLGQRQFRGSITLLNKYAQDSFENILESDYVDSAVSKDQIAKLDTNEFRINIERMPLEQTLEIKGRKSFRRSIRFADLVFESSGKRLTGQFTDLIEIHNKDNLRISFL